MASPPRMARPPGVSRPAPAVGAAAPRIHQQRRQAQPGIAPSQIRPNQVRPGVAERRDALRQNLQTRREQLQQRGNLNRAEQRQLRTLQRQEQNLRQTDQREQRRLRSVEERLNRLQARQKAGTLNPQQQRQLQRLEQTQQRLQARQRPQEDRGNALQQTRQGIGQGLSQEQRQQFREQRRAARVTPQQVQAGRFAAAFRGQQARNGDREARRALRRAMRIAARAAWRQGAYASYVPWRGALYWPYAYTDVFHYTFWPYAYEPAYWATVYDDLFDGVFFPDGAPYVDYAEGPYPGPYAGTSGRATTGAAPSQPVPGRVTQAARELCAEPDKGITAWPVKSITEAVQPTAEQKALLDAVDKAGKEAAARFRQVCPESLPMTPPGRLQAMTQRLQATLDAVELVKPPLAAFYDSLSDEQKARFNEVGPQIGRDEQRAAEKQAQAQPGDCGGQKSGLSGLALDRIEDAVQPTKEQEAAFDRLGAAMDKAVETLAAACPTAIPLTPVGRLEAMEQRLKAMIEAANVVQPALDEFYAALSSEQKAAFNRLSRQTAQAN